jgi:DNA-binding XRE family transcriptional regulator
MTTTPTSAECMPLVDFLRRAHLPDRARRRAIRESVGASIRDVAAACGVSHFSVYSWEKPGGKIEPSREHKLIYRRVLDDLEALRCELDGNQTQK